MSHYYCYILDQSDRIRAREIMSAADDSEVVGKARSYLTKHPNIHAVEVWLGERRVQTLSQIPREQSFSWRY